MTLATSNTSPAHTSAIPLRLGFRGGFLIVPLLLIRLIQTPSPQSNRVVTTLLLAFFFLWWLKFHFKKRQKIDDLNTVMRLNFISLLLATVAFLVGTALCWPWNIWLTRIDEALKGHRQIHISSLEQLQQYQPQYNDEVIITDLPATCAAEELEDRWGISHISTRWDCSRAVAGPIQPIDVIHIDDDKRTALRDLITLYDSEFTQLTGDEYAALYKNVRYSKYLYAHREHQVNHLAELINAVASICPGSDTDLEQCATLKDKLPLDGYNWEQAVAQANSNVPLPERLLNDQDYAVLKRDMRDMVSGFYAQVIQRTWKILKQQQSSSLLLDDAGKNDRVVFFSPKEASNTMEEERLPYNDLSQNASVWSSLSQDLQLSGTARLSGYWVASYPNAQPPILLLDSSYFWIPLWIAVLPFIALSAVALQWLYWLYRSLKDYRRLMRKRQEPVL
uniref:hypothetical protein n=1 Tax=Halomonas sp. TaxID=1486246 RepID=UPI002627823B|nr:hypothetical protein [Halomonas sp.]